MAAADVSDAEAELYFCVVLRNHQLLALAPRNGLEALRFRRSLQLPASSEMVQMPPSHHGAMVSEAFAEHYESVFLQDSAPEVLLRNETIPRLVRLLQPGDLRMLTATDCTFNMPPTRTRLLWQQLLGQDRPLFLEGPARQRLRPGEAGRVLRIPTDVPIPLLKEESESPDGPTPTDPPDPGYPTLDRSYPDSDEYPPLT